MATMTQMAMGAKPLRAAPMSEETKQARLAGNTFSKLASQPTRVPQQLIRPPMPVTKPRYTTPGFRSPTPGIGSVKKQVVGLARTIAQNPPVVGKAVRGAVGGATAGALAQALRRRMALKK